MPLIKTFFLLVITSIALNAQTIGKATDHTTSIKGHIIDATTGEAMPLVLVTFFLNDTIYKSVRADFDGYFIIHIPSDKIVKDKSALEFIIFGFKKLLVSSYFDDINNLTIRMAADPDKQVTREDYERLCKERYDYANECGTKD